MKPLVILKLGGSIITDKKSEQPKVNEAVLQRLAKEISEAYKEEKFKLILIHGAGSYGHQIVKRTGIHNGIKTKDQIIAFAETQRLQNELNTIVSRAMIEQGVPTFPVQPSASAIMYEGRLQRMEVDLIGALIECGLVPVLFGVPAYDIKQKCSILSGDQTAPYLAKRLGAKKIIHATDVNGIYSADPKTNPNAVHIPEITEENIDEVKKYLGGSTAADVTGGMLGKVLESLEIAKNGIKIQIVNGLEHGFVKRALLGEPLGTLIYSKAIE